MDEQQLAEEFIARWRGVAASELSTAQTFVLELCALLGVEKPYPTPEQDYMFERPVRFAHGDGSFSEGRIDCYFRSHFVLEAKKLRQGAHTRGFDDALMRARAQAEGYARALPADEGRPPFLVVVDVGHVMELYSEFTRSGATYTPFPDPRTHRIRIDDLRQPDVRERLRLVWTDPMRLDPSHANAKVTREVAARLAEVARSLEAAGHSPHDVAAFLTRCLFSMFAEDVDLLPRLPNGDGAFVDLLRRWRDDPPTLQRMMAALWVDMDRGGFSAALAKDVLRFNGKLFKVTGSSGYALPLNRDQIDGLLQAAKASWKEVEPAIFGTLLERALDPGERHSLGAHYTPRSYVERLVLPTVVEPLREDWANAQAAALLLANEANALEGRKRDDKLAEARTEIRRFHHALCSVRVLDPACGSGNFLYVTLEHLKRLEGEVVNQLEALGDSQARLHLEGETVTLKQLLGIEVNERAAALAELVLWIGYLQWHIRTFGNASVAEPVVHDYGNIDCRDAVLEWDGQELMHDDAGKLVTRWDWITFKPHPATGELVPDENARVPQWRYVNPRQAAPWPDAEFIVGNPPYIGNKRMRDALGDGYVQALRQVWRDVPDTADFVMYWWDRAADLVRTGHARRFGLITTNSLRQVFNRQTVQRHLDAQPPLGLRFVVPDHPWVDSANGAAVRVAMSVGGAGSELGELLTSIAETTLQDGEANVTFESRKGMIHADLTIGAKVASARRLRASEGICFQGMNLVGKGFRLSPQQVNALGYDHGKLPEVVKPHFNARDFLQGGEPCYVIDFFGYSAERARAEHPALYQWLLVRVKPERDLNNRESRRKNWWLFGEPVGKLRSSWRGLSRIIITAETAKHRIFAFQPLPFCPDHTLYAICSDDALILGTLSSRLHALWSLRAGGTLEDRPRWQNTTTFLPFPFPSEDTGLTLALARRIGALAEQIDTHRKSRQVLHSDVTLTGLYNVLEKLRAGAPLTDKERQIHEHGLVSVLKSLHDELDAAVLAAYGWSDLTLPADADTLLERLVTLNTRRAQEEAAGTVRWLRAPAQSASEQAAIELQRPAPVQAVVQPAVALKRPWPTSLPDQIRAVADVLATQPAPVGVDTIAAHFTARGRWRERLPTILQTLTALGRAREVQPSRWLDAGMR